MRFRWSFAILLLAGVLPVSLALAEHPKWAPMAPQPVKKTSHTSHAARYYRGPGHDACARRELCGHAGGESCWLGGGATAPQPKKD